MSRASLRATSPTTVMGWVMKMQFLVWMAALVALPALAQPVGVSAGLADGRAVSPMLPYQSAFADYRAWSDPQPMNWRKANDEAGEMGGHMGHLRGRAGETRTPGVAAPPSVKREPSK